MNIIRNLSEKSFLDDNKTFTKRQVNRRDMILSKVMRRKTPGLQMWAMKASECYSHHIYNHVYASNPIIADN
jgi:hypothetical protein